MTQTFVSLVNELHQVMDKGAVILWLSSVNKAVPDIPYTPFVHFEKNGEVISEIFGEIEKFWHLSWEFWGALT